VEAVQIESQIQQKKKKEVSSLCQGKGPTVLKKGKIPARGATGKEQDMNVDYRKKVSGWEETAGTRGS